jgi:hypothetical protein
MCDSQIFNVLPDCHSNLAPENGGKVVIANVAVKFDNLRAQMSTHEAVMDHSEKLTNAMRQAV